MTEVKDYPPYLDYPKSYKPKTNADRIRAMNDKELSQVLGMFVSRNLFASICNNPKITVICDSKCFKCISEWLKLPAEVD